MNDINHIKDLNRIGCITAYLKHRKHRKGDEDNEPAR